MIFPFTACYGQSASLLDNILTNQINPQLSSNTNAILVNDVSDHFPVLTIIDNTLLEPTYDVHMTRNYTQSNQNVFNTMLRAHDWSTVLSMTDCQSAYQSFVNIMQDLHDRAFPLTKSTPYRERKSWLPTELIYSIKIKNKLYRKYLKNPTDLNKDNYKAYKNTLNRKLREAEKQHYTHLIDQNKKNPRKSWQVIKEIIGKKSQNESSHEFKINEDLVSDPRIISNQFNQFFTNVGPNLASQIPNNNIDPTSYINNNISVSLAMEPTDITEVKNILNDIKTTSAGWDSISSRVLKHNYDHIARPLTHITNLSISQGVVPKELKKTIVRPIFKKGDKREFTNYRPISILPLFSKVVEKTMYKRIYGFLTTHNLLYDYQFGFRQKYSTNFALIHLIDKITEALKNNESIIGVFLDFSKAFDTIDHNILLAKLNKYGIRGIANKWIENYLFDRSQAVKYRNATSEDLMIKCGVPQGSILGPLLFLIYINDLPNIIPQLFSILFADDTSVFISGKNIQDLTIRLNSQLKELVKWLECNRLSLNVAKTNFMLFSRKTHTETPHIEINGQKINKVNHLKFLGITIDDALNWKIHITNTRQKIAKSIGILSKCRKVLNNHSLLQLYHAFISPYLSYGIELWGSAKQNVIHSLQISQKRSVRILCGVPPRTSSTPLFKSTQILPLQQLYEFKVLEFMFKFNNHLLPNTFASLYVTNENVHNHNTRQRHHLHHTQTTSLALSKTIRHTGINLWNPLPQELKHTYRLSIFKQKLKLSLLNNL